MCLAWPWLACVSGEWCACLAWLLQVLLAAWFWCSVRCARILSDTHKVRPQHLVRLRCGSDGNTPLTPPPPPLLLLLLLPPTPCHLEEEALVLLLLLLEVRAPLLFPSWPLEISSATTSGGGGVEAER